MKRILSSLLIITMINGCVQAPTETDKLKESFDVEQSKKSEETVTIKKIDKSKDWVYVDSKIDLSVDTAMSYPYVVQSLIDENTMYIEIPVINIQNDEIIELNNKIRASQETLIAELGEYEGVPTFAFSTVNVYHFEDVYSLVIRTRRTEYNDIPRPEYLNYNINIKEGKILDNFDLFALIDFSIEQAEINVLNLLKERDIPACEIKEDDLEPAIPCYPHTGETLNGAMHPIIPIDENSKMFVDNDGKINYYPDLYKVLLELSEFRLN